MTEFDGVLLHDGECQDVVTIFHMGRINLKIGIVLDDDQLKAFSDKTTRDTLAAAMILVLEKNDTWSESYHEETAQAIKADEYWFEVVKNDPLSALGSCDKDVDPHQRYLNVKDQLDDNMVLKY